MIPDIFNQEQLFNIEKKEISFLRSIFLKLFFRTSDLLDPKWFLLSNELMRTKL